jgi:hypothetical protein
VSWADEVVEELDEELALIDLEADAVDRPSRSEIRRARSSRCRDMDLGDAVDAFADPVGELARRAPARLAERGSACAAPG